MKNRFSVVEDDGVYVLYKGSQMYISPCFFNVASSDKGLAEAIARKLEEGKPNLVKLYLREYDNKELVKIIIDSIEFDDSIYECCGYDITNNPTLCAESFTDIQLRKLIDAYSECGSMYLSMKVAINDVEAEETDVDHAYSVAAQIYYDSICDYFENNCCIDVTEDLSVEYLEGFIRKYNAVLVPQNPKARSEFPELLRKLDTRVSGMHSEYDPSKDEGFMDESLENIEDSADHFAMGDKLLAGDGVEKDVAEAVKCYAQAISDDPMKKDSVQQRLDEIRETYGKVDLSKLMQPAKENGDSMSQFLLGDLHFKIKGEEFSVEEGLKWYRLSAENGLACAQVILGKIYCVGDGGVEVNVEEGKKWLNLAKEQDDDLLSKLLAEFALMSVENQEEEARDLEAKTEKVAERMASLDEETLRKFEIVREFVSKYDDFWADFEDCDAVYRPFFHSGDPMRFWFNPPYDENGYSCPCESDKLILTKAGEICVENHFDGEFYNILDCVEETLDNAVQAIESYDGE